MKMIYGVATILGFLLMFSATGTAYANRGYFGYGGEWLILPMCIVTAFIIDEIHREYKREKRRNEKDRQILPKE